VPGGSVSTGTLRCTLTGSSGGPSYAHETYSDWTNETLVKSLAECWELQIFDPVWGRNSKLIPLLQKALITAKG